MPTVRCVEVIYRWVSYDWIMASSGIINSGCSNVILVNVIT